MMFLSMVAQETILVSNSTAKPADSQIEFYMYFMEVKSDRWE